VKIAIKRDGKAVCVLTLAKLGGGDYEIAYLRTEKEYEGKGLARLAMERAEQLADKKGWRLVGLVDPDKAQNGMTSEQIKGWLARRGYKPYRYELGDWHGTNVKRVMIREPKTLATA
jgi:GNAT superfamily N-acetyltransferase